MGRLFFFLSLEVYDPSFWISKYSCEIFTWFISFEAITIYQSFVFVHGLSMHKYFLLKHVNYTIKSISYSLSVGAFTHSRWR